MGATMQDEYIVRDLSISDGSCIIKASYFVEAGILHASVDGRNLISPVGDDGSKETVRRLIAGRIQTRKWRERATAHWHTWQVRP
jgi:hypothetical protein